MKKKFSAKICFIIIATLVSALLLASCGSEEALDSVENIKTETAENAVGTVGNDTVIKDQNAKIIREISMTGETKDFESASEMLKSQINEAGGYIESSEINGGESLRNNRYSERRANYIIRIPAEKLDDFLNKTKEALNVTSFTENTTDVTLEYYDIQARLDTLKSKKAALEAMLEKATTLDEIITVQDSLYSVIADIEAYQSQLNVYDSKVNYSTVTLDIYEVSEYTEESDPTFGERISNAFNKGWKAFGSFFQSLAVFFVAAFPFLLALAVVGVIVILIIRLRKKKRKNEDNNLNK